MWSNACWLAIASLLTRLASTLRYGRAYHPPIRSGLPPSDTVGLTTLPIRSIAPCPKPKGKRSPKPPAKPKDKLHAPTAVGLIAHGPHAG